jgi:hypothetical protein
MADPNPLDVVMSNEEFDRRMDLREAFLARLPQAEQTARSRGSYFSPMTDVWIAYQETIQDDWLSSIERTAAQGTRLYGPTTSDGNVSHPMSQSDSSSLTNTTQSSTRFDMFQNETAERAHLLPDSPQCHKAYGFLAQAATGKRVGTPLDRLKLLNGVKKRGSARRSPGCGLKHHKYNKMYLERQKDFFDGNSPRLILVPVYGLEDLLNWNGTDEYDVMAITVGDRLGMVCSKKILEAAPLTCDRDDVETATELLKCFCKAIACSVRNDPVGESFEPAQLDANSAPMTPLKKWAKLKNQLEGKGASVGLPNILSDVDWANVKVAKARASRDTSLPDPFMMAIKAAVNFSAILGTKLMPACPEPCSDGSSSDGEMNSTQQEDESQWPQNTRVEDLSSLIRSFGHPVS